MAPGSSSTPTTRPPATPEADVPSREDIFSVAADGSDLRRHTRCGVSCTFPSYSPDGSSILYRKSIEGPGLAWDLTQGSTNSEVFVAAVDGSDEVNLSKNAAFDGWPAWSPDGRTIAFASNRTGPARTGQIWLVEADGMGLHRVTDGPWSHARPRWSPDGRTLFVYELQELGGRQRGIERTR